MKIIFASGRRTALQLPCLSGIDVFQKNCRAWKMSTSHGLHGDAHGDAYARRQSIFEFVDGHVGVEFISPLRLCGAESCHLRSVW
ncbi:hypothetical protein [Noviherbaspirillum sp.]|uniref:hypothetical protein n=1 Tax=Noviherbaspirillum sp. TaxID=1926288 RepID=UPI002FE06F69